MKNSLNIRTLFFFLLPFSTLYCQTLIKIKVSPKEQKAGIEAIYNVIHKVDGQENLILYRNGKYHYKLSSTVRNVFSKGSWRINNNELLLTSYFANKIIPVVISTMDKIENSEQTTRTPFSIPVNLKGVKMSDSRVFLNNDSLMYCFPFFDTCIGNYNLINFVRIDFSNGYSSKWIKVNLKENKRVSIVAQINF